SAKVWDFPSSKALRSLTHGAAVEAVALSPDGTRLAAAGKDGTVKIWDTKDGKELSTLKGHEGAITGVSFSGNGQLLATSGSDRTVRFWNPASGRLVTTTVAHSGPATAVVVNPNGASAYSAGDDGTLKFWQLPPVASRSVAAPGDTVTALHLSGDGNQVLTGSADKSVRLTSFANGQAVRQFAGATSVVTAVAPGNTLVAAGTEDSKLFLWNAADGKLLTQAVAHGGAVTGVSFHPNGTQLLTSGRDGLVKVWALPPVPARSLTHPDGVLTAVLSADGK